VLDRLLNTSLYSLSNEGIERIARGGVREDGVTEFKRGLDEGAEAGQIPWAEGGRLSRTAKADLLKELVAFANAYGGTLYIGVTESRDEQRRSAGLSLVPRIFELETALCDAMRDTIEPRLPSFDSKAFEFDRGAGVLAIRVPSSPIAPHWNTNERRCYLRIGTSSQVIGMREIHSIVLDRARTSEGANQQFADRQIEFRKQIRALAVKYTTSSGRGADPRLTTDPNYWFPLEGMALRCSCVPLMPISIIDITSKQELRVGVKPARIVNKIEIPGTPKAQGISNYQNIDARVFRPSLRGWSMSFEARGLNLHDMMTVRGDGLIERVFIDLVPLELRGGKFGVDFTNLVAFALSMITSVEVFRTITATNEVPYELELELITYPDRFLMSPTHQYRSENYEFLERRIIFPRLLLGNRDSFNLVSDAIQTDISNATSQNGMVVYDFDLQASLELHGL
jgi:Putative DNA-binding domain